MCVLTDMMLLAILCLMTVKLLCLLLGFEEVLQCDGGDCSSLVGIIGDYRNVNFYNSTRFTRLADISGFISCLSCFLSFLLLSLSEINLRFY